VYHNGQATLKAAYNKPQNQHCEYPTNQGLHIGQSTYTKMASHGHSHDHSHDQGHDHSHSHDHTHDHAHEHARPQTPPTNGHHRHASHFSERSVPSPIKIDLDYDIRHNLNESPRPARERDSPMLSAGSGSSMLSPMKPPPFSATSPGSQWSPWTPNTPQTGSTDGGFQPLDSALPDEGARNPFNFTTQQYVTDANGLKRPSVENLPGKRRGHKYRHSSIHTAHQIFQPPTQRTPLAVPAHLPMPTRKEAWWSMTPNQTMRLIWCACHFLVSGYVQFSASGSLSMTALSRLLLFDAAGATVCVAVDVMSNFEVWQRGSLKHPFGLERADVLAGFGMAVFIGFMGLDVVSHGVQHALENLGDHVPHNAHSHSRATAGAVDLDCLLAIAVTLVSAIGLRNHSRIGRAMRMPWLANWGRVLGNPSHFLTLSVSVLLFFLPLFSEQTYNVVDIILSLCIAGVMITFGTRLGTSLASMLLMSYRHPTDSMAVRNVIKGLESDPGVSVIEEVRVWQVHYGLCMANLKLKYRPASGYGDEVLRIRQRVTSLIRSHLGSVYGEGKGPRWDVSVQMAVERD